MFPSLNAEHEQERLDHLRSEHQHSMQLGVIAEKGTDAVPKIVAEEFSTAVDATAAISPVAASGGNSTFESDSNDAPVNGSDVTAEQLGGHQAKTGEMH
jgi:hypothetical protein